MARHSESRQTTKWAQTTQTRAAMMRMMTVAEMSAVNQSRVGSEVGSGLPTNRTSATGTPTPRTSTPSSASSPWPTLRSLPAAGRGSASLAVRGW